MDPTTAPPRPPEPPPPAVARARSVRILRHASRPALVPALLVLANLAVYGLVVRYAGGDFWRRLVSGDGLHYALLRCGGKSNALIAAGEPWRLLSALFLHGSLLHLAVNAVGVWYLGRLAENAFGRRRAFLLYLLSGIAATATSVLASDALSVGASGAVFGLLGGIGVALVRLRAELPPAARRLLVVAPLLWGAGSLLVGWFVEDIDNAAHLGGLAAGALLGLGFRPDRGAPGQRGSADGWLTAAAALGVGAVLATGGWAAFEALRPLPPATARFATAREVPGGLRLEGWRAGRLHERRCLASGEGPAAPPGAPWCFGDPYESLLIVGAAAAVFPEQDELVRYLEAADGPEAPVERATGTDVLFILPGGGGLTYVLVCYPELAERYRPLAEALYRRLDAGVGGVESRP